MALAIFFTTLVLYRFGCLPFPFAWIQLTERFGELQYARVQRCPYPLRLYGPLNSGSDAQSSGLLQWFCFG